MKRLIIDEVNSFRAEVRAQARAAGQIRRQDRYVAQKFGSGIFTSDRILQSPHSQPGRDLELAGARIRSPSRRDVQFHCCGDDRKAAEPHHGRSQ